MLAGDAQPRAVGKKRKRSAEDQDDGSDCGKRKARGAGGAWRAYVHCQMRGSQMTKASIKDVAAAYRQLTPQEMSEYAKMGSLATEARRMGGHSFPALSRRARLARGAPSHSEVEAWAVEGDSFLEAMAKNPTGEPLLENRSDSARETVEEVISMEAKRLVALKKQQRLIEKNECEAALKGSAQQASEKLQHRQGLTQLAGIQWLALPTEHTHLVCRFCPESVVPSDASIAKGSVLLSTAWRRRHIAIDSKAWASADPGLKNTRESQCHKDHFCHCSRRRAPHLQVMHAKLKQLFGRLAEQSDVKQFITSGRLILHFSTTLAASAPSSSSSSPLANEALDTFCLVPLLYTKPWRPTFAKLLLKDHSVALPQLLGSADGTRAGAKFFFEAALLDGLPQIMSVWRCLASLNKEGTVRVLPLVLSDRATPISNFSSAAAVRLPGMAFELWKAEECDQEVHAEAVPAHALWEDATLVEANQEQYQRPSRFFGIVMDILVAVFNSRPFRLLVWLALANKAQPQKKNHTTPDVRPEVCQLLGVDKLKSYGAGAESATRSTLLNASLRGCLLRERLLLQQDSDDVQVQSGEDVGGDDRAVGVLVGEEEPGEEEEEEEENEADGLAPLQEVIAQPRQDAVVEAVDVLSDRVLAHPGRWGAFSFSLKQPKGTASSSSRFGAYECTCPFHRKNDVTGCKKLFSLAGADSKSKQEALARARFWATQARNFNRQRDHMFMATVDPVPSLQELEQLCILEKPSRYVIRSDVELDAALAKPKSKSKAKAKAKAKPIPARDASATSSSSSSSSTSSSD